MVTLAPSQASAPLSYSIAIGHGLISELPRFIELDKYSKIHLNYDSRTEHLVQPIADTITATPLSSLAIISGESAKSLQTIERVLEAFCQSKLDRNSLVINLGGGMLGDMGGFAASIYMRGIDFIQIPTTLLAQVDASVGGKVAVNFAGIKNLIGSFQQPKLVLIDVDTLATLPTRELNSGFAEIVKHALISDLAYLQTLETLEPDKISQEKLIGIIKRSCEIKAHIVGQDPKEKGLRKILNFGHTIGHAIESISAKDSSPLLHGECVALGMLAEASLMWRRGKLSKIDLERIKAILQRFNLPIRLSSPIDVNKAIDIIYHDKKNSAGTILCALIDALGTCSTAVPVSEEEIRTAIIALME